MEISELVNNLRTAFRYGYAGNRVPSPKRDAGREAEIRRLRFDEGWTLQEIGTKYGISRERVRQIIDGQQQDPEEKSAQRSVMYAIKSGRLTRLPCRVCGNPKTEAHHEDYSKPLDVVFLCRVHHRAADAERRARLAK
jgi:hypothetical protein